MRDKILSILIRDCLQLQSMDINESDLESMVRFSNHEGYSIIFVHEDKLTFSEKSKKDVSENLVVENSRYSDYLEKDHVFRFCKEIGECDDVYMSSFETGIPLSRLTNDYFSIHTLPESYHNILENVYKELKPLVDLMRRRNILIESTSNKIDYYKTIRGFITNELA